MKSLLSIPYLYDIAQFMMRGRQFNSRLAKEHIRAKEGDRILDIGCGTCSILDSLPTVSYVGLDLSRPYIEAARKRYGSRGTFHTMELTTSNANQFGLFDLILAIGVVHHLYNPSATHLFQLARQALRPGGRIITLDGVYTDTQSWIVKRLLSADRGKFVRTEEEYLTLAKFIFPQVQVRLREDYFRIPYTTMIMECSA